MELLISTADTSVEDKWARSQGNIDGTLCENHFTIKNNSLTILDMIYFRYTFLPFESNELSKVMIEMAAKSGNNEPRYFGNLTAAHGEPASEKFPKIVGNLVGDQ